VSASSNRHWWVQPAGKADEDATTREPGDLPCIDVTLCLSGVAGGSKDMTTTTKILSQTQSGALAILAAAALGAFLVFGAGLAQSAALHDAAHDTRHAIGFPCH